MLITRVPAVTVALSVSISGIPGVTVPTFQTPVQFTETIKEDLKRWGPVVKTSGFVAVD